MFDYENPSEGYKNFSERMRQLGNMPAHEYADAYMKQMNLDESALPTAQQLSAKLGIEAEELATVGGLPEALNPVPWAYCKVKRS